MDETAEALPVPEHSRRTEAERPPVRGVEDVVLAGPYAVLFEGSPDGA